MSRVAYSIPRKTLVRLTVIAIVVPAFALPAIASAAPGGPGAVGCSTPVLATPQRAQDVERTNPPALTAAAKRNHRTETALRSEARRDGTLWLDRCAQAFYVEPASGGNGAPGGSAPLAAPLADTFALQSRPGANRTIYLDFTGGTVSGTAWQSGATISVEPFSISAPADTAYTDAELTEIQGTWQVVAEDYAPFDVNVTTRDPGLAAIDRSSSTDLVYGAQVMVTNGGPVYDGCGCGGLAYVDVFNLAGSGHMHYLPAWVFSAGVGTTGKNLGEAAAHEVGHVFGLLHDGTATAGYSTGTTPWAPIMGVGYYQPITQWSKGEYPGANNTQDDLALIASGAPLRVDDHGDTAAAASPLPNGTAIDGVIATRTDVDAFRFTASGATTVTVTPAAWMADLDVQLRVVDAAGATIATVNPAVTKASSSSASGLGASWSATLPSTAATYTAIVDGVGTGDPATAGLYSDYASLGNYRITLSTQSTATTLSLSSSTPPAATANVAYSATPVSASGGVAPYRFAASGLPAGLTIGASAGAISGTPTVAGSYPVTITVTDAAGSSANTLVTLTVDGASLTVTSQSFTATVRKTFSAQLTASGGDGSYAWTASSLPPGLTLSASGLLSGTPTKSGTFSFTVKAASAGLTGNGTVAITIARR